MAIYNFGAGTLWGVPAGTNQTPVKFGVLQECTVDIKATNKELFGGSQYPVAVGRGTSKISGKAKFGQLQASAIAQLFFGQTPSLTQTTTANGEAGTIPAPSGPYTITVANSATWVSNLGVINATTGYPLKMVASGPTTGQYSVAAGVYTFAAADTGIAVLISYKYTISAAGGQIINVPNSLIGIAPTFSMTLESVYSTGKSVLTLNACISESLNFGTKLEDFAIPEFDFSAFADQSGNVMSWNFNDLS